MAGVVHIRSRHVERITESRKVTRVRVWIGEQPLLQARQRRPKCRSEHLPEFPGFGSGYQSECGPAECSRSASWLHASQRSLRADTMMVREATCSSGGELERLALERVPADGPR